MDIEGSWRLVVLSPIGKQVITTDLHVDENTLTGTATNEANQKTAEVFDGSVSGDTAEWKITLQEMKLTLTFNVTVADDSMSGKVKAGHFGKFSVSGDRVESQPLSPL
jgi:hypothetical protein